MNTNLNTIISSWDKITEKLKNDFSISDVCFNTWINPLKPLKIENDTLFIGLPEEGYISVVKKKYKNPLIVVIEELLDYHLDLEFTTYEKMDEKSKNIKEQKEYYESYGLNPIYTFDNFVVGSSNSLAHATCLGVAGDPGKLHNPLYIYGNSGLGKTHLLHAIALYALKENPSLKIRYVTCENIMEDYTNLISLGKNQRAFKEKYRNVDMLLIDDIQFLANKKALQEEFFNTFNTLYENKKQLVFTADVAPRKLQSVYKEIEERIITRVGWGISVDIEPPDYETRIAILRKKEDLLGISFDNEIIKYISTKITTNIRDLESALGLLRAKEKLINNKLTLEEAKVLLEKTYNIEKIENKKEKIAQTVADHYHVLLKDLLGEKKTHSISKIRQIAIYLISLYTDETTIEIGKFFNNRDHSTIVYSIGTIDKQIKVDRELQKIVETISEKIK